MGTWLHELERKYDIVCYIVSKCYLISDLTKYTENGNSTKQYEVVFPYQLGEFNKWKRAIPSFNFCNGMGVNGNNVDFVFDSYEEAIHDDIKVIALSDYGRLKLFKINYSKEIERFKRELEALRYDVTLLDDFLLKQDLTDSVWAILNVEKLEEFCNEYDRAITIDGVSFLNFERLESNKKTILDENGKQKMRNILSVWDEGHCIHICHPNHIFAGAKLLIKEVRNIKNVNWEDIDVQKMFDMNNYGTFIMPNCKEAFKYVHNRFSHQIIKEVKRGNKESGNSYLVVVEKYRFDYENYYLIRGIIKADYKGYSIAFNPEYEKVIPESIFEKQVRFSGNEVPKVYCIKRKR